MRISCHKIEDQKKYDIKRLHRHLLDILSDVIRVCAELEIDYFIMGGTALGAVRHGGFIPWDDDLDIGMRREDYEKFLAEAQKHLREDLFLQTYRTEPGSPFYFAKVRKDNTKFVEKYCRKLAIHSGIYIDIFPYDALPDDEKERKNHYRRMKWMLNLYIAKCVTGTSVEYRGMKRLLYGCVRHTLHLLMLPVSKRFLYRQTDRMMRKYNDHPSQYLGYGGLPKIQVPRADVLEPAEIAFENLTVKCPQRIETYLSHNFGDYKKLPPEEQRGGHAPWLIEY